MSFTSGQPHSIFDAFRPGAGQTVSRAVAATYSLDLVALLGLVLVLGGDDGAGFDASPLGLADAFRKVSGRLMVLHQGGRLNAPGAQSALLPLLDTMVQAVGSGEADGSWHPKVVLVRYASQAGPKGGAGAEWRLWIGSRNLTGTTDLDAGLLLVSGAAPGLKRIPGVAELASGLLAEAAWTVDELEELRTAKWTCPAGIQVRSLVWRRPGEKRSFLTGQSLRRPDQAWAVSPFINRTGLAAVGAAAKAPLALLTTRRAGTDCAPFEGVGFRVWSAPEPQAPVDLASQQAAPDAEFADPPPTGIHAKLLMTGKAGARALLLGSANLTGRGLLGPNAEAGVWLDVTDPALAASLSDFINSGMELIPEPADPAAAEREQRARALEAVISRFLEQPLRLEASADGLFLSAADMDGLLLEADFLAAPFHQPENFTQWKAGARRVRLLDTPPPLSGQTALVVVRARSHEDASVSRTWTQKAELAGFESGRRDDALLARYIGAGRFRAWLKSTLDGIDASGTERWSDPAGGSSWKGSVLGEDMFTLEAMLGKWAADADGFEARLPDILTMLASFRDAFAEIADTDERARALQELDEVTPFIDAVAAAAGARPR